MSSTEIRDTEYRKSHMSAPRGRGGWIFAPAGKEKLGWDDSFFVAYSSTYTEARAQLRNHLAARRAGGEIVPNVWYVMP